MTWRWGNDWFGEQKSDSQSSTHRKVFKEQTREYTFKEKGERKKERKRQIWKEKIESIQDTRKLICSSVQSEVFNGTTYSHFHFFLLSLPFSETFFLFSLSFSFYKHTESIIRNVKCDDVIYYSNLLPLIRTRSKLYHSPFSFSRLLLSPFHSYYLW